MTESRKKYLRNHQEYYVSKDNAVRERKVLGDVVQDVVADGYVLEDDVEDELQCADDTEVADEINLHEACEGVSVNAVA